MPLKLSEIISIIGVSITVLGILLYWTGRWYKERYFNEFHIPYELLDFDYTYYVFGGWNTFLVSLSFLPVVLGFAIAPQLDLYWMWLIGFAVILCCYVLSWVNLLRGKRWKGANHRILVKFLTSYDLDLIGLAILSALVCLIMFSVEQHNVLLALQGMTGFLLTQRFLVIPAIITLIPATFFYLMLIGQLVGKYHGITGRRDGKMGIKHTRFQEHDVLVVARTKDGRLFLFPSGETPEEAKCFIVHEDHFLKDQDGLIISSETT